MAKQLQAVEDPDESSRIAFAKQEQDRLRERDSETEDQAPTKEQAPEDPTETQKIKERKQNPNA
jgi:hypothetical protein